METLPILISHGNHVVSENESSGGGGSQNSFSSSPSILTLWHRGYCAFQPPMVYGRRYRSCVGCSVPDQHSTHSLSTVKNRPCARATPPASNSAKLTPNNTPLSQCLFIASPSYSPTMSPIL